MPTSSKIRNIDNVTKNWMFFSWLEDRIEKNELTHKQICLLGSFWNPKAAQEMLGMGDSRKVSVSDKDFENAVKYVANAKPKKTNKRKKLILSKE